MKIKTLINAVRLIMVIVCILLFSGNMLKVYAQAVPYNLARMLKDGQIVTVSSNQTRILENTKENAITTKGIIWLRGIDFKLGTIDIDLRGKGVFLKSFLGIAFHGIDTDTCDILYFRPFNFRHEDTLRRKWSVVYMSIPENNWAKLRKEHPLIYENAVSSVPKGDEWFHATIVINKNQLYVYVNHSDTASLKVTLLNERRSGLFGLYSDGLTNDFANLAITTQ